MIENFINIEKLKKKVIEVLKLKMQYKDVDGAYNSGGQSMNVWGQVKFPMEILEFADYSKLINKRKSCLWTASDDAIFCKDFDKRQITPELLQSTVVELVNSYEDLSTRDTLYKEFLYKLIAYSNKYGIDAVYKNEELMAEVRDYLELKLRGIPYTISATFKSGFKPYTAVSENLSMHIAVALDMPTSYNYIVAFDKDEHPEIVKNYKGFNKEEKVQSIGIVSVDFLQCKEVPEYETEVRDKDGNWTTEKRNYSEDILVPFESSLTTSAKTGLSVEQNLVENWIAGIHNVAENYMSDFTQEEKERSLRNIDSRVVRSFLLREFLGDCDFTAYNGGIVINSKLHSVRYAPNFDYGESFNPLIKEKLDVSSGISESVLNNLPSDVREYLLSQQKESKSKSIEEIACMYSNDASKKNLEFVLKNYPYACKEFFDNLKDAVERNVFDGLVEQYTTMACNGVPLLTDAEAEDFKAYIKHRSEWMMSMYNESIMNREEDERVSN